MLTTKPRRATVSSPAYTAQQTATSSSSCRFVMMLQLYCSMVYYLDTGKALAMVLKSTNCSVRTGNPSMASGIAAPAATKSKTPSRSNGRPRRYLSKMWWTRWAMSRRLFGSRIPRLTLYHFWHNPATNPAKRCWHDWNRTLQSSRDVTENDLLNCLIRGAQLDLEDIEGRQFMLDERADSRSEQVKLMA